MLRTTMRLLAYAAFSLRHWSGSRSDGFRKWLAIAICALVIPCAHAQTSGQLTTLTVDRLFAEDSTTGGFFPVQDISATCLWGLMYVDLGNPAGRAIQALLMQAKAQNLFLQRVDYSKTADGKCTARGVHIQ